VTQQTMDTTRRRCIIPREQIEQLIEYLAKTYPKTFFTQPHLKRPLKKNILLDLETDRVLDDDRREAAVSFYQRDWCYEATLLAGAKRIDLNGKEVGTVTPQEQIEAQKRVQAQKQQRREKLKAQGPVEVLRKLHADGKISTDQLSKITAPAIESVPMAKAIKLPQPNGVDLTRLHMLWNSIESVLSTDDENLRAALVAPALKVLVAEATNVVSTLERRQSAATSTAESA
jgi:sRNA-binding protein